jgi:hypothetical protein
MADILVKDYNFIKISFADTLKDIISIIFNWDRKKLQGLTKEDRLWREEKDEWWSDKLKITNFTPRFAMQFIGTELFRKHFNIDIWMNVLERKLMDNKDKNIVIPDCRFLNEIDLVKKYDGIIINIYRNLPLWYYEYKNNNIIPKDIHSSEIEWIKYNFDYIINNNNSIEDLKIIIKSTFVDFIFSSIKI